MLIYTPESTALHRKFWTSWLKHLKDLEEMVVILSVTERQISDILNNNTKENH